MKGILIHLRSQPEPKFWTLFGEIRPDLDRLHWCFAFQPWFGAPADFDPSVNVCLPRQDQSSVILWKPGSLSRFADKFCEECIRLLGIDADRHDPVDVAATYGDHGFDDHATPMNCSEVYLEYTDSTCWEIYASDNHLLERLNRSLRGFSGVMLYDMEWKHRERDFRAALGYRPGEI